MTALLTDNLPLLAGAPNGIKKLRELILELAVRGKLVPQDPSDEPASELLKRIAEEKARLVEEGKIKKQKSLAEVPEKEKPYELPISWEWVRLAHGCHLEMGQSPSSDHYNQSKSGIPFFQGKADFGTIYPTARYWCTEPTKFAECGDVLLSIRAPVGPTNVAPFRCCIGRGLAALRPLAGVPTGYLLLTIRARQVYLEALATGTTFVAVSKGDLEPFLLPMPPLAEQHRIVAKVDELMALCDQLEARQADAECAHAQLVQALLESLTQARDAEDFAQSWQRLAEHFHTLFTTESSIDALKQTLLQLAVMGKLVPQDPNDEPASELLRNIQLEKQAAIVGRNKLDKLSSSDTDDELPFKLPSQWVWTRLGELAISGPSNGNSPKPASVETPYRCLTLSATTRGAFNDQCFKFVDIDADTASKYFLKNGDLLIQRANSIDYVGVSAIYDGPDDQFIFPDLMMRLRVSQYLNLPFIHAYLSSITGRAYFRSHASGTQGNMPKINQGTVVNAPIPIPPLPEQHRIVAKVDQLMALCDQLKARLGQARQVHEHLANALVEQAVA